MLITKLVFIAIFIAGYQHSLWGQVSVGKTRLDEAKAGFQIIILQINITECSSKSQAKMKRDVLNGTLSGIFA